MTKQEAIQKTRQGQIALLDLMVEQAKEYGDESVRRAKSERDYYLRKWEAETQ